jgi:replicative DNA helicase
MNSSAKTSESIVIGMLINNIDLILEIKDLKAEYFSTDVNKIIFIALKRIYSQGVKKVDIADIYALVEVDKDSKRTIDKNGGLSYLDMLQDIAYDKDREEINIHVKNIIDCAYKNEMTDVLGGLMHYVKDNDGNTREDINKTIENDILDIKAKYSSHHKVENISENIEKTLDKIAQNADRQFIGFPTSIPLLNEFITYRKGELLIYTAKAKVGKSQTVVNESYHLAIKNNVPVMILDTELSTDEFIVRMLARVTGYTFSFIESGQYLKHEKSKNKVRDAVIKIKEAPLSHTYIVGWSHEEIASEIKRMKIQKNIQVVMYDYIKIESVSAKIQERDMLGNITNWLKNDIAGSLDLAVIALAQTSDYNTQDRGIKIANSEKIKNYASTVVFLLEKDKEQYSRDLNELGGTHYLFIPYNRHGASQKQEDQDRGINIVFEKNKATIRQADYQLDDVINLLSESDYDDEFDIAE